MLLGLLISFLSLILMAAFWLTAVVLYIDMCMRDVLNIIDPFPDQQEIEEQLWKK